LPALPGAWPNGSVSGLRARGGLEVSISWKDGRASIAGLKATLAGQHKIRPPKGQKIAAITQKGQPAATTPQPDGTVQVTVKPGDEFDLRFE
jgi:alpha-L-fucosidase 2